MKAEAITQAAATQPVVTPAVAAQTVITQPVTQAAVRQAVVTPAAAAQTAVTQPVTQATATRALDSASASRTMFGAAQVMDDEARPKGERAGGVAGRIALGALALVIAGGSAYLTTRWLQPAPAALATATPAATAASDATGSASAASTPGASRNGGAGTSGAGASGVSTSAAGAGSADGASGGASSLAGAAAAAVAAGKSVLEVQSTPAGARVVVGGLFRGLTPQLVTDLSPGRHDVLVGGPFPSVLRRIDVIAGKHIVVNILPGDRAGRSGATVAASGESAAAGAGQPGREAAAAAAAAGNAASEPAGANSGGSPAGTGGSTPSAAPAASAPSALAPAAPAQPTPPAPPAAAAQGRLIVESPLALDIHANGRRVGNSGDGSIALAPGSYELELVNDSVDYREVTTVRIAPGQRTVLPVSVPRSTLAVEAEPGTIVWVDGREIGQTPLASLALSIGPHDVRLRHPQLGERRVTALVRLGLPARVAVDFRTP